MPTLTSGSQLGDYRILRLIGEGGMGEVYEAYDVSLERRAALKVVKAANHQEDHVQRFMQEARTLAKVNHPNIVAIHSINTSGEVQYIAMEHVNGVSLKDFLAEYTLSVGMAIYLFEQMMYAVKRLHEHHIVHRDLKPGNILIRVDGQIKILDFGIAKTLNKPVQTGPSIKYGTPYYMAPELKDSHGGSPRSDFWSLGAVLYQCLTSKFLLTSLDGDFLKLSNADLRAIPQELRAIIGSMCAPDPNDRYKDADEILEDLHRFYKAAAPISQEELLAFQDQLRFLTVKKLPAVPDIATVRIPNILPPSKSERLQTSLHKVKQNTPHQRKVEEPRSMRKRRQTQEMAMVLALLIMLAAGGGYKLWKLRERTSPPTVIENSPPHPLQQAALLAPEVKLVEPADGQVTWLRPQQPLELHWSTEVPPNAYNVQVAKDDRFQKLVVDELATSTDYSVETIGDGNYFWRLHPRSPGRAEIGPQSFSIFHAEAVQLLKPENRWAGGSLSEFEWTCKASKNYVLQIATDEHFQHVVSDYVLVDCHWSAAGVKLPPGSYFWRVRNDIGQADQELWSSTRSFAIKAFASELKLAAPSVKDVPRKVNLNKSMDFAWSKIPGAKKYNLQISQSKDFDDVLFDENVASSRWRWLANQTGRLYWRVRALSNSSKPGPFSSAVSLEVMGVKPVPVNRTVAAVIPKAEPKITPTAAPPPTAPAAELLPPPTQDPKTSALESDIAEIEAAVDPLAVPVPLLPSPGVKATAKNGKASIDFSWRAVNGADGYSLELSSDSNFASVAKHVDVSDAHALIEQLELSGRVYWRVQSHGGGKSSKWSAVRYFDIR